MRVVVLWIAVTGLNSCYAQSDIWADLIKRYPDESGVYLSRDKTITLQVKNDSLQAVGEVKEGILFLKDRPDDVNDMRIFGSHFLEVDGLQANTLVWEKSKYKTIPLVGLNRKRDDDGSVFYDDSYFYHMSFPATHAGNQATWSYSERYRDTRFLPAFYFQSYLPQVKTSFILRLPPDVEIKWHILNDENKQVQFKKYVKGSYTHYEWTAENVTAYKREAESPSLAYYSPVVVYHITNWRSKTGVQTLLNSLDDLNRWYQTTLQATQEGPTNELMAVIAQLKQPDDAEIDIVRKVFYWVQDNIRYIAFEDGMRGLVPHKASYVLEKRYGDCKDMASLIAGLLRAAGIKSYYTWIGTRDIPYRYSLIPSPLVDNHMITTYIDENQNYYFLDGTSNHTPLSFPSSMIQGKEAFIAVGPGQYEVKVVPEIVASRNAKVDTVHLTINGSTITGRGRTFLSGYQKVYASYDFNKTVALKQKENVVDWTKKGSNKFFLDTYQIQNLGNNDLPLTLDYTFRVSDYVTYAGDEIYLNLNLTKVFYNELIAAGRKAPIEKEYQFLMNNRYIMTIPDGYEVEHLPPNKHYENALLSFDFTYSRQGQSVSLTADLESKILLLAPSQFEQWNKDIRELSSAYKETIILKKKSL